jgi:hypothetical protein
LKGEALDRAMWRNHFGEDFEPVARQNTEWMKSDLKIPNTDVSESLTMMYERLSVVITFNM